MSSRSKNAIERELFLRSIARFEASPSAMSQMLALMRDVAFAPGDVIFRKGAASDYAYFVSDGSVELRDWPQAPWRFDDRSVIGIIDAVIGRPYHRTAVALTPVKGLRMGMDDYSEFLEDNFEISQSIIAENTRRLFEEVLKLGNSGQFLEGRPDRRLLSNPSGSLSVVERLLILRQVRPFSRGTTQALASLAERASVSRWNAGDVLFRQGDAASEFWVIADGQVTIERATPQILVRRGPGDLVQSYAAFGADHWRFTARCTSPCLMLELNREDLLDQMEAHFELTRSVLAYMSTVFERLNRAVAESQRIERLTDVVDQTLPTQSA